MTWMTCGAAICALSVGSAVMAAPPLTTPQPLTPEALQKVFAGTRPLQWNVNQGVRFGCFEAQPEHCEATIGKLTLSQPDGAISFKGKPVPQHALSPLAGLAGFPAPNFANPLIHTTARRKQGVNAICVTYVYDSFNGGAGPLDALVMILADQRRAVAYRFDGFYSNCDNWRSDGKGHFLYGGIELLPEARAAEVDLEKDRKALVWSLCTLDGCARAEDRREVVQDGSTWSTAPAQPPFRYDSVRGETGK
ncbi:hypothetical protein G7047_26035 [Diaphorobacter sp. HDW4A]|uniref:hypothetical protein n=1 Tax=Diaphorobacter sp. HDW4A TaxID=2714924 RepID=UPI00140C847D|nr:hypothetical protein [Diaphorobacter sp. HDW4A]QIL83012.1 hypothetical protein G7047_26035 [Diaphorobacter sp. HDW4A]